MQIEPARTVIVARYTLRGAGYLGAYLALGTYASVVATLVGMLVIFVSVSGGHGLVVVLLYLPAGLVIGFPLSMPVTFIVCPVLTVLLKEHPATNLLALAVGGAITGGLVTGWWGDLSSLFGLAGTAAGLVAGMAYSKMARKLIGTRSL
jgi:hypothetical protein